jgi:hypothetical protein
MKFRRNFLTYKILCSKCEKNMEPARSKRQVERAKRGNICSDIRLREPRGNQEKQLEERLVLALKRAVFSKYGEIGEDRRKVGF